jgi:SAM-dependent methyltransferase
MATARSSLEKALRGVRRRAIEFTYHYRFALSETIRGEKPIAENAAMYFSLPFETMTHILRRLSLTMDDVVVDLGCGKGRFLVAASRHRLHEVIGVELSPRLSSIAQSNIEKLPRSSCRVTVINQNVTDFDYSRGTIYYLYNPFAVSIVRACLNKLRNALLKSPRFVRIVYVQTILPAPFEELDQCDWLERCDEFAPLGWSSQPIKVVIWHNLHKGQPLGYSLANDK